MGKRAKGIWLAAVLALGLAAPASADDAAGLFFPGLVNLLPDTPETSHSVPVFGYLDLKALAKASGLRVPASEDEYRTFSKAERLAWSEAMRRVSVGPADVIAYPVLIGPRVSSAHDALGIDWFGIEAAITFWQPPSIVTAIVGEPEFADPEKMDAALSARGFERDGFDGFAVWHKLDDNALALGDKDPLTSGDFLMGRIPRASRIAVTDGMVVHTTNWPALRAVTSTVSGAMPASPVARLSMMLRETAEATTDAALLQATAFMLRDIGAAQDPATALSHLLGGPGMDVDAIRKAIAPPESGPRLPLYPMALLADMQAGQDQFAVIALPYPDKASAVAAAEVVAERLATWTPRPDGLSLLEQIGGSVESHVVERDDIAGATFATFIASLEAGVEERSAVEALADLSGGAVAVIVVRYPVTEAKPGAAGAAFRAFVGGVFQRGFTPLAAP